MREIKNVVMQYSDIELKVRDATNNDRFMVSSGQLAELARATNDYQAYPQLFSMLWKRLTDLEHVMHVQKALAVVEYLLRHGAERFINDCKRRARDIAALQKYKHYNEHNQDDAKEARARAKAVSALLMDDQLLTLERSKSARLRGEGRIGGVGIESTRTPYGPYDEPDTLYDDEEPAPRSQYPSGAPSASAAYVAALRPRPAAAAQSSAPSSPAALPRSSSASSTPAKSGAGRRPMHTPNDDNDPYSNPARSESTGGGSHTNGSSRAKAKSRSQRHLAVDEPAEDEEGAEGEGEGEEDEEERKRRKKEKKRKKREKEEAARRAAEAEAAAEAKRAATHVEKEKSKSSKKKSSRTPAVNNDLMSFAEPTSNGEIDILTGDVFAAAHSSPTPSTAVNGGLSDLFASQSLVDGPGVAAPSTSNSSSDIPLFDQLREGSNGSGIQRGEGQQLEDGIGERGVSVGDSVAQSSISPTGTLVNFADITDAPPVAKAKKHSAFDGGVSMNMMRSIQPMGTNSPARASADNGMMDEPKKRRSHVPASIPLYADLTPSQPPPLGPYMHPSMPIGVPYGYPAHPAMQAQPIHPGLMPLGPLPVYGQQGQGQPLAIMPPGMGSQGPVGNMQHMYPPSQHQQSMQPFPSPAGPANTFTQMRQGGSRSNAAASASPPIFEVHEAPLLRAVEPINYMHANDLQPRI